MVHVETKSPTRESQLQLGATYQLVGQGTGLDMIPAQVFRLESMTATLSSGSAVLVGTLWYKFWLCGRWYSGTYPNHQLLGHNVGIGSLTGMHDFHLEALRDGDAVKAALGSGRAYHDYIAQTQIDDRQGILV